MANIFLDTNYFIHFRENTSAPVADYFSNDSLYISTLSCHIYCYVNKTKIPDASFTGLVSYFKLVNLTEIILGKAMTGPTDDLEDNIQLHSAAAAECDYFLTNDTKLLKMKFFGKTRIVNQIQPSQPI